MVKYFYQHLHIHGDYDRFVVAFWVIAPFLLFQLLFNSWLVYRLVYAFLDRRGPIVLLCKGRIISHIYQPPTSSTAEIYRVIVMEEDNMRREAICYQFYVGLQEYIELKDQQIVKFSKMIGRLSGEVIDKNFLG